MGSIFENTLLEYLVKVLKNCEGSINAYQSTKYVLSWFNGSISDD